MSFFRILVKLGHSPRRLGQLALAIAFLIVIYLPGSGLMLNRPKSLSHDQWEANRPPAMGAWRGGWEENRPLPKLMWRLTSILSYPKDFGEYFRFNFAFRKDLIHWHGRLAGQAMGKSSSPLVVEGKHGWLFLGEHGPLEDYRGMLPFTDQQLQDWQRVLESRRNWLAKQGIPYLFVVCPDKHTIYPEHMPDRINRVHAQTRLDQLLRHMKEHSNMEILDLRPALLEFKKMHLCYQPQESHWNGVGAFVAYQQIARRLQAWYPNLRPLTWNDCEIRQQDNPNTDLLRLQGRENVHTVMDNVRPVRGFAAKFRRESNRPRANGSELVYSHREDGPIARALVVCDSFMTLMMPFLGEHFRDALFVWVGGDGFVAQDVQEYKPDVVIQEIVERSFCEITPKPLETLPAPACTPLSSVHPKDDSRTQQ